MNRPEVSILILTKDEEVNLPRCLAALDWCNDIVVIDSGSRDRCVQIAEKAGCRIIKKAFTNFAEQRNYGLEKVNFRNSWVLHLDADEVMTPELCEEIGHAIKDSTLDAFRIPSKTMFMGKWLRHAGMYPVYQVRLTRLGAFRFMQVGHGQREDIAAGRIGTLNHAYIHYPFSKGITDWFERHNRYSTAEADETVHHLQQGQIEWFTLVKSDSSRRRRTLKEISYRLPFRPSLRFIYMYVLRLGFLDGQAGFSYCRMLTIYETMIALKVREFRMFSKS